MTELKTAGYPIYDIMALKGANGQEFDLTPLLDSLVIYEDMFSPVLTGHITILDTINLFNKLPITGNETLTFKGYSWDYAPIPKNEKVAFIHRTFDIIKVTDIVQVNDYTKKVTLHFASPELKKNNSIAISKSYINSTASNVVANIMTSDYLTVEGEQPTGLGFPVDAYHSPIPQSPFIYEESREAWYAKADEKDSVELFVEKTKYTDPVISFPYMKPFEIINWLAARSLRHTMGRYTSRDESMAANFMFFENKRGFQFVSIDTLLEGKDFAATKFKYGSANQNRHSNGRDVSTEVITEFQIQNCYDIIKNMKSGLYASKLYQYDISTGLFTEKDYNYLESFNKSESTERTGINGETVADYSIVGTSPDLAQRFLSKRMFVIANPGVGIDPITSEPTERHNPIKETTGAEEYIQNRLSQLARWSNYRILFEIQGNSKHKVGDCVQIDLKDWKTNESSLNTDREFVEEPSKYYSGNYLITSIKHVFTKFNYTMSIEAAKDSYKNNINENKGE